MRLQLFDALGGFACANKQNACGERVERAGMPHLDFLCVQFSAQQVTHSSHDVERCPFVWLVE
jgi:hypothetical protein